MGTETSDPVQSFRDWQHAIAALNDAESRGESHANIVALSAEVIRTRNAMTEDLLSAGADLPEDVLKHLTSDDQLLRERDDAVLSNTPPPSASVGHL